MINYEQKKRLELLFEQMITLLKKGDELVLTADNKQLSMLKSQIYDACTEAIIYGHEI